MNAVLRTDGTLMLVAQTISIAQSATISASGTTATAPKGGANGNYESGGGANADHAMPHPGVPGAATCTLAAYGCAPVSGGKGGGMLALVARRILVAGTLAADGTVGPAGANGGEASPDSGPYSPGPGGGGGSGGGILLAATEAQVTGRLSVAGGAGGPPGSVDPDGGSPASKGAAGSSGLIKVFVSTLHTTSNVLPVTGQAFLSGRLPVDPTPPDLSVPHLYEAATMHNLEGPFLAFWQQNGGLATFGYPRTEAFTETGVLEQYTDRALLQLHGGTVQMASLGTLLLAGRHLATVAPFTPSKQDLYFPSTRHSLSGQFLAFWQSHHGSVLLGTPISEPLTEGNGDGSGRRYLLQWFEKGRVEVHPEATNTQYAMQLGLLGVQALQARGWLPASK